MPSLLRVFALSLAPILALSACGGTSVNEDPGASGGTAGAGNAAGVGGSTGGVSGGGAGGVAGSGTGGGSGVCPASFPSNGTACALPSGVACSYEQGPCCPAWIATCEGGVWNALPVSCPLPPQPACPVDPPTQGAPCSSGPCNPMQQYCTYGQCADGTPSVMAECVGGAWNLSYANCLPTCEGLSACDCFARSDCTPVSDSCICECDYQCPGVPPCDCVCGGGNYLGCKPATGAGG